MLFSDRGNTITIDGNVTRRVDVPHRTVAGRFWGADVLSLSLRSAVANFVDGESRAIKRVGRQREREREVGRGKRGISRNGGQKVRARSEKRARSVGSFEANHDAAGGERDDSPRATWSGSRELLASEVHAQVSPSRLPFFFLFTLAFEGKLKAARGKGAGMLDAVNEFLPYRINSSRLI